MDAGIAALVKAMNAAAINTRQSCEGYHRRLQKACVLVTPGFFFSWGRKVILELLQMRKTRRTRHICWCDNWLRIPFPPGEVPLERTLPLAKCIFAQRRTLRELRSGAVERVVEQLEAGELEDTEEAKIRAFEEAVDEAPERSRLLPHPQWLAEVKGPQQGELLEYSEDGSHRPVGYEPLDPLAWSAS